MTVPVFPRLVARIIERIVYHVVRLFLAFGFLAFGASKLLNLQFAWGYEQFDRPVRHLAGMGLVWTFFAYSHSYQICIGFSRLYEVSPGRRFRL